MKHTGPLLIVLSVLSTISFYILSKSNLSVLYTNIFLTIIQISALLGTTLFALSFFLSSRMPVLDYLFGGLDKAYFYHKRISAVAYLLILHHFLFLLITRWKDIPSLRFILFPSQDIALSTGILAFWIMTLLLILTLFVDLPYHIWKKTHEYFGLVILIAAVHTFTIPSDISFYLPLRYFMLSIIFFGIYSYVYRRFLYSILGPRYQYIVKGVRKDEPIIELTLSPIGKKMAFIPGQFAYLSVKDKKIGSEDHPFSISSIPSDDTLRFSIKASGNYTKRLMEISEHTPVTVWGPYGNFGERLYTKKDIVFVAGGIGITPFLSMIKTLAQKNHHASVHVFYTTKTKDEAVYDKEIQTYCFQNTCIQYKQHASATDGRLTVEAIKQAVTNINNSLIFLCGPPIMMQHFVSQFSAIGVKKRNIIYEDFNLK